METVQYNYEVEGESPNEKIWFNLDTFPQIKFCFAEVRLGGQNEDGSTAVTYTLDVKHIIGTDDDEKIQKLVDSPEFNQQVREFLTNLLEAMINTSQAARDKSVQPLESNEVKKPGELT